MCDNIILMKAGIFFYIFMSFVWMGAAYCAPGDSMLIYHDFPKTMKDVSFIDMLELKTKGYEPWFDKKVYTGITLEKKTAVAAGTAGKDEDRDYCVETVGCSTVARQLEGISDPILETVIAGGAYSGMYCEQNREVEVLGSEKKCLHYCQLDKTRKALSKQLCFYANVDGKIGSLNDEKNNMALLESTNYKIYFSGVKRSVGEEEAVKCGDKLGDIQDKANFFYCVVSNNS